MNNLDRDVAKFLLGLVGKLTLQVGTPDFDEAVVIVQRATKQLNSIIESGSDE